MLKMCLGPIIMVKVPKLGWVKFEFLLTKLAKEDIFYVEFHEEHSPIGPVVVRQVLREQDHCRQFCSVNLKVFFCIQSKTLQYLQGIIFINCINVFPENSTIMIQIQFFMNKINCSQL